MARRVIGACIEVHSQLGPGRPESYYENALAMEFDLRGIPYARQPLLKIHCKGRYIGKAKTDFVVAGRLIVEIKAIELLLKLHAQQVKTYLRSSGQCLGLLINSNVNLLKEGIQRIVWTL